MADAEELEENGGAEELEEPDMGGVLYDPSDGIMKTAFRIGFTVVPGVLRRFEFWVFLLTNIVSSELIISGRWEPRKNMIPSVLQSSLTGLMTFFLVFYTNNCFIRYFTLYAKARDMMGALYELVSECRLRLKDKSHRRKVMKYVMAGVFSFFWEATEGGLSEEHLEVLRQRGFLNLTEVAFFSRLPLPVGAKSYILLHWAQEVTLFALGKGNERYLTQFQGKIFSVRRVQLDIHDTLKMPLPYQYFHIMNLMLLVNLSVMAISVATFQSRVGSVAFGFMLLIFLGIREMSTGMADPFGDDEVDFPVNSWLHELYKVCQSLLEYEYQVGVKENMDDVEALTPEQEDMTDLEFFRSRREMLEALLGQHAPLARKAA